MTRKRMRDRRAERQRGDYTLKNVMAMCREPGRMFGCIGYTP